MLIEYANFTILFSKKLAKVLPKQTGINNILSNKNIINNYFKS